MTAPPLIVVESSKPLSEISRLLPEAAARNGMGVIAVHDLRETMRKKGVDFKDPCLVFEVCNPIQARKVLDGDLRLSSFLPCRISVYERNGRRALATIKPTMILSLVPHPELAHVAQEVESALDRILAELT